MSGTGRKILYLCGDKGIPYWGNKGSSIHVREFVSACRKAGNDISVIARIKKKEALDDKGTVLYPQPSIPEAELLDQAIRQSDNGGHLVEMKSFYVNPYMGRLLRKIISRFPFELIYERYSLFSVAGFNFARKNDIPFVLEVNSPLVIEASRYRNLYLKDLAEAIEKHLFSGADHIVAVSDEVKKYIMGIQRFAGITVVPNGVDVDRFMDSPKRTQAKEQIAGLPDSDVNIAFFGRVRPWHGVDILIDAFADIAHDRNGIGLVIVGDAGELKEKLLAQSRAQGIESKVQFVDAVAHDKIPSHLSAMDILVAPYPDLSDFYFSALKIFEYMAAGKAIVASRIGQIDQVLTHDVNALLVAPGDKQALSEALMRLLKNPDLRSRLGKNAQREALEKHSWQNRFETISAIFDDVTRERGF